MKKFFSCLLPLIITALALVGETSPLKAQTPGWSVSLCKVCFTPQQKEGYCVGCKEYKSLTNEEAKICTHCYVKTDMYIKNCCYVCSSNAGRGGFARLCRSCAKKNQCIDCRKYLGSGNAPDETGDTRKVIERYTVRITIPGQKEIFMSSFNKGVEALGNKEYEEAIKYFDIEIKEDPDYYEAYYQKASTLISLKREEEAGPFLKKAIDLNVPYSNSYLVYAGICELYHKDYEQAIKYYELGFELKPEETGFRGNLIGLYQQLGKLDDALKHANILCTLLPNSAEALSQKAELLFNSKKWNEAIPIYEQIISMDPDHAIGAYYYLGLSLYQVDQFENARENWKKFAEIDEKKRSDPYALLAVCEMKLNNPIEAEKYCETTLELLKDENPSVFYNLACAYSLLNKVDKGLELLEKALKTGQVNIPYMESDKDLINVRQTEGYKELISKYK
ncbi:MAG: tetratricopeptide repeat protein [bacterium]